MTFAEVLERVIYSQQLQIEQSNPGRAVKYIIYKQGDSWTFRESPCPNCNPPGFVAGFVREVTGTVWYCKKHQSFWDSFCFAGGPYHIARMEDVIS